MVPRVCLSERTSYAIHVSLLSRSGLLKFDAKETPKCLHIHILRIQFVGFVVSRADSLMTVSYLPTKLYYWLDYRFQQAAESVNGNAPESLRESPPIKYGRR